jgi:DNA polymerase-1
MVAVQNWLAHEQLQTKMVMQVHDELVLDVPLSEVDRIKDNLPSLMCDVASLRVPLVAEVGVGPNWEQAH